VLVADKDAFAGTAHTVLDIVLFETLETSEDGGVFFWLGFFGAEGVVRERVKTNCFRLVVIKGFREYGRIRGLQCRRCYG